MEEEEKEGRKNPFSEIQGSAYGHYFLFFSLIQVLLSLISAWMGRERGSSHELQAAAAVPQPTLISFITAGSSRRGRDSPIPTAALAGYSKTTCICAQCSPFQFNSFFSLPFFLQNVNVINVYTCTRDAILI